MRFAERTGIDSKRPLWRDPKNRQTQIWAEHRDLNEVAHAIYTAPRSRFFHRLTGFGGPS